MARPRPQDPQALAATIAALRAAAEDTREGVEGAPTAGLRASGADKAAAQRLLSRFDRLTPSLRRNALGEFADRPIERASRAAAGAGTTRAEERRPGEARGLGFDIPTRGGRDAGSGAAGGGASAGTVGSRAVDDARAPEPEGAADEHVTASYAINYEGFRCEAETNWDGFTNSDEVYAITSSVWIATDGQNQVRTEKHPTGATAYEDVDAGETRRGPVARCWEGSILPVSLSVVAFEHDYGDPNEYRDEVDAIVKAAIAALIYLYPPAAAAALVLEALKGTITDAINWLLGTGDDRVDIARTEVFDQARLEEMGKHEIAPYPHTELYGHFFSTHIESGAKYVFAFRLERTPPFVEEHIIL